MRDHRTPEQIIRAIMEGQANAATLEYGSDAARDTYAKDTPGQEPGEHTKKHATVLGHSVPAAVDGIPGKGGEMAKPNPERLAGLGKKESYQGNPYLKVANQDIIQENAFEGIVEMSDVEFDDMIEVLTVEELNDLEEGIMKSVGKGIAAVAKGTYKAGKYIAPKIGDVAKAAAHRMSTSGRADAAERKLARIKQNKKDKMRLDTAKANISKEYAPAKKTVADSYELGSRDYWTQQDELDLAEGKMSPAEVKKHAAAIFKMRQKGAQAKADKAASSAMSAPKSAAAKAARRDAASAGYGKPKSDSADKDTSYKAPKRGRGEKDLPHIVSQLRGVVDTKKGVPSQVKFKDGSTKNVNPKHAQSWLKKHDSAKPQQKLDMYKSHDSHKSFKSYAKEAVEADDKPKLKKLAKGLTGSVKGHAQQVKDIEKIIKDEKEFKMKSCGCGEDPCKTYGSKEDQMKEMQEAQRRWDRSSKGRAYRRLSDEEKQRLQKKNELIRQMRAYKGDDAGYESKGKMGKPTIGKAKSVYKGRQEQIEAILDHLAEKYSIFEEKCGPGEYWCTKDMKCKPIPKGMTTDKDGMLVKESFRHYEVTHKPTGKKYKVTAMHDKSAKEKARAQHGGTASRYSGTSTDDFHTEEKMTGSEYRQQMAKVTSKNKKVRQAVTNILDKKKDSGSNHADVKAARKYMKVESSDSMDRMADTWNDHADNKHPKVQKHIKKAEKAYNAKDHEGFFHHTQRAADHAYMAKKKPAPVSVKKEEVVNELDSKTLKNYIRKAVSPVNKKSAVNLASKGAYKLAHADDLDAGEKEDAKAFRRSRGIQTAAKKLYKRANEEVVNEISDKTKVDYIKKAKKQITDMEKHDLDRDTTTFVPKLMKMKPISYSKLMKRRRGVRTATGKLGEMSMSVTLKPKKDNMYKVTKVGDKMKKHGGIKKGEKFHDSEIDGMHDSGIKVRYHKESTLPSKVGTALKTYGIAKNPKIFVAKKVIGGVAKIADKITTKVQTRRGKRNMSTGAKVGGKAGGIRPAITPTPKPQFEASAAEVLKKRYASYNPGDNPQATRRLKDDEHDQPKGARVWKMHPGVKLTHRGYSKKGKMAALKKQHERRPEQYGITKESYAARIAEKMNYPKSAQADMNKMADKEDKNWWKAQDKEKTNKAKLNKINNMGTRHGT